MSAYTPPPPPPPPLPNTGSDTKQCPFCLETIKADAVRCRHCRSWLQGNLLQHEWYRADNGRIAGVCAGLGEQFNISPTILRLLFALSAIFGAGIGLIAYLVLWAIMPVKGQSGP